MFSSLSQRLTAVLDGIRRKGVLSESDVSDALREIRIALLEADVALPVVKDFISRVKDKAIGQDVLRSITPGQMVVKIVNDELIETLGGIDDNDSFKLSNSPPTIILMAGLQGSGKTTSTAKLALYLRQSRKKKVLMVSTDIYRPSAMEQLSILGAQIQIDTCEIIPSQGPVEIAKRALLRAKTGGYDALIVDTSGRMHNDSALMEEIRSLHSILSPHHTLLVVDAMTGQDAVTIAKSFSEAVGLTGLIMTRLDGDARGGAALSARHMTGCPIMFAGVGEKIDQLELFSPERMAGRILGMGDVVSLVEKAAQVISEEDAAALAKKMQKGSFDMNDLAVQLSQVSKMGGMGSIMSMLPGMGKLQSMIPNGSLDDKVVARQIAIIRSMTAAERKDVKLLNGSRRQRVAKGSGTSVQDVNKLVKSYMQMADMMKKFSRMGSKGLMRSGLQQLLRK